MSLPNIDLNGDYGDAPSQQQPLRHSSRALEEPDSLKASIVGDDCLLRFYHQMQWSLPFPQVPASVLLHKPSVLRTAFTMPKTIMSSEIDAMSTGILSEISLTYFPIRPHEIREMKAILERNKRVTEEKNQALMARGQVARTNWAASEINPDLHPDDAALLDTDLDVPFIEQRTKPSLTLLQRPTYTELGTISKEERHELRKKRLLGEAAVAEAEYQAATAQAEDRQLNWYSKLKSTFKSARGTDELYRQMVLDLAAVKFGLVDPKMATRYLRKLPPPPGTSRADAEKEHQFVKRVEEVVTAFWQLLFAGTNVPQQCFVWSQVMLAVDAASGLRSQRVALCPEDLTSRICNSAESRQLHLLHLERWTSVLEEMCDVHREALDRGYLHAGVPLPTIGANDKAMGTVQPPPAVFAPNYVAPSTLLRNTDKVGEVDCTVFPVEIMPIYPSNFHELVQHLEREDEGTAPPLLAQRCGDRCTEVVVRGIKPAGPEAPLRGMNSSLLSRKRDRRNALHMLINRTNLLMAHHVPPQLASGETTGCQADHTVTYTTSREHVVQPYLTDESNTSSYLFQVLHREGGSTATASKSEEAQQAALSSMLQRCGGSFKYSSVALYDGVPRREEYRKDPAAREPPHRVYVMSFEDEGALNGGVGVDSLSQDAGVDEHVEPAQKRARIE